MWFDRSARFDFRNGSQQLDVAVPNRFVAEWIGKHFHDDLRSVAREETGGDCDLNVYVDPQPFAAAARRGTETQDAPSSTDQRQAHGGPHGLRYRRARAAAPQPNLRYRIDDFVVGASNELAVAAAHRLVDDEADHSHGSPLFIHGGVGLGKTHLLQGICQKMLDNNPGANVLYTTGEQFTNEFLTAVRSGNIDAFRKRIRVLDLLAVDDIHFIANKNATQQEFLHSFNAIELVGARVVLASDAHPKMIQQFSEALVSRCVRGLVVEIKTPDPEMRRRLVSVLAQRRGITLADSAVETIAQHCRDSVRELEGTLTKLKAMAAMESPRHEQHAAGDGVIGHTVVARLFAARQTDAAARPIRIDTILTLVSERLAVSKDRIVRGNRQKDAVVARGLVVHLARTLTPMSFPEIAAALGRPSHSTVVTAYQRVCKQIESQAVVTLPGLDLGTTRQMPVAQLLDDLTHALGRA